MLHRRDGVRFLPDVTVGIQVKEFNIGVIRLVWESLGVFWQTPSGLLCAFFTGHSIIKAWLVECCRDGCPSGRFSHLHRGTLELCQSDRRFLGHPPDQGPSLPTAQFGWAASSRKSLGGSKNNGSHCVLGDLQCCRHFLVPFPKSVIWPNPVISELYRQFLQPYGFIFVLTRTVSTVGLYIDRPFQIMFNQLKVPQMDSNEQSMQTGCTWAQFQVS